jgi:hypothetical protein
MEVRNELPEVLDGRFKLEKKKEGGAVSPGPLGGIYTCQLSGAVPDTLMIKRETRKGIAVPAAVMAEFLAAVMMNSLVPGSAPLTFLLRTPDSQHPDDSGENVYLASVFHQGYKSFHEHAFGTPDKMRKPGQETLGKKKNIFREALFFKSDDGAYRSSKFEGYNLVIVASLLLGDFDAHSANIGTSKIGDSERVVRIDFGAALAKLSAELNVHSHSKHLPGLGPANHFREIPREVKINHDFANTLSELSSLEKNEKLCADMCAAIDTIAEFYGSTPMLELAEHIGMQGVSHTDKAQLCVELKGYLQAKMMQRAASMQQLATEIKMSLCVTRSANKPVSFSINDKEMREVIRENPLYFIKGDLHFRDTKQRINLGPIKIDYSKPSQLTNELVASMGYELLRDAIEKGSPEVIQAMLGSGKFAKITETDYEGALQAAITRKFVMIENEMKSQANPNAYMEKVADRIILEIAHGKSEDSRLKIIRQYISIFDMAESARSPGVMGAISLALANPAVKLLNEKLSDPSALIDFINKNQLLDISHPSSVAQEAFGFLSESEAKRNSPKFTVFSKSQNEKPAEPKKQPESRMRHK